jgi:hypothetical protein
MAQKRDHACIWFAHLPSEIARELGRLDPDQRVQLFIDGYPTTWRRMKPGAGRPTPGIRLESGREVWNNIALGQSFSIALFQRVNSQEQPNPLAQPDAGSEQLVAADPMASGSSVQKDRVPLAHGSGDTLTLRQLLGAIVLEGGRMTLLF